MNKNQTYALQQVAVVAVLVASACIVVLNKNDKKSDDDVKLYYANTGVITILTDHPGDTKYPVFYGDSFFKTDATKENIHMANFALGLELSCFHYPEPNEAGEILGDMPEKVSQVNLKQFYSDIGFGNVEINQDFESKPQMDSIGVGIGSKVIDGKTVLAVAINGVHYTAQFGGNFKVGEEGTHEGFQLAANKVVSFIREYIAMKSITGDVKILLTGYSRGAATSNIAQAMIDDAIAENKVKEVLGDVSLSVNDMYGFGFMTPMTVPTDNPVAPTDPRYDNIFSYIDPNDVVPMVPPALFGFTHFGHVVKVPANDKTLVPAWYKYVVDYFGDDVQKMYDRSTYKHDVLPDLTEGEVMQNILDRFVKAISDGGQREVYYNEIQQDISLATFATFSNLSMVSEITDQITSNIMTLILATITGEEKLRTELHNCLDAVFQKYSLEDRDGVQIINTMTKVLFAVIEAQGGGLGILTDPYFRVAMENGGYMLMPHMPQNICGWMFYLDSNYPDGGIKP